MIKLCFKKVSWDEFWGFRGAIQIDIGGELFKNKK